MSGHTPGPWRWEVHPRTKTVHLSGGRPQFDLCVMTCERWGMSGAAPSFLKPFSDSGMMLITRADKFMVPIAGREHHSDWIQTIDHPDARLIAAAPDLLDALIDLAGEQNGPPLERRAAQWQAALDRANDLIEKLLAQS